MILRHFNLRDQPFGATPDVRSLFASRTHREALASLLYGIEAGRGFLALIAEPGMGKTTLLFRALGEWKRKARTALLFQSFETRRDLLCALLMDLGVKDVSGTFAELQETLIRLVTEFARSGQALIIVIDEAQNLSEDILEFVRTLSNFESSQKKLVHIVLAGQPALARKLSSPGMTQLRQRISIVAHLEPFTKEDARSYIEYRLAAAGWNPRNKIFDDAAVELIAQHSDGIPRNINTLCFNALSIACALQKKTVGAEIIREVISDLDLEAIGQQQIRRPAKKVRDTRRWEALSIGKIVVASMLVFAATAAKTSPEPKVQAPVSRPQQIHVPIQQVEATQKVDEATVQSIIVQPGATLDGICAHALKATCKSKDIREIKRLNPWLTNSRHLQAGRKLRIAHSDASTIARSSESQECRWRKQMSRNFELMEQMESQSAFYDPQSSTPEPPFSRSRRFKSNDDVARLIQQVFHRQTGNSPQVVVFAGIDSGEGNSSLTASIADALADTAARPVCLVEANLRSPNLPELFKTTNHHGFTDALSESDSILAYTKVVSKNLWLLSSGALVGDSANLLNSPRVKPRLEELRKEFEFVIVDAPALSLYSDAIAMGRLSDGIVLLIGAGTTRRETAQMVQENLRTSDIPILGAVLNNRTYPIPEAIYKRI